MCVGEERTNGWHK